MKQEASARLHQASPKDLLELRELMPAAADGPRWPDAAWDRFAREEIAERGAIHLLRGEAGHIQGWIAGTVVLEVAEIEFVYVCSAHRGKGLGAQLVREWAAWAAGRGAAQVQLEVRASNAAALRLYRELGFAVQGKRPRYYRQPVEDAVLMTLRLPPDAGSAAAAAASQSA